ncbi:two pore domain potassium channel family protein [Halorarum halophilum]|uniref:Two pore domain potassium channel family protein n=1 Tax=Halorarum halophilum TaxID=2743090 RepID=A0A7D5K730_9EURY|nr:two pore domain potassium channel family protein [Halobaculum halophilum]QLG27114.1 two pore domain potassium channel family protein [Halobaculum halophilum]
MTILYTILGIVLLVAVVVDILWTTLWVDGGAGPLSSRLSNGIWNLLRTVSSRHSRGLSLAGPIILISSLMMWIGLLWIGWTFVFAGGENAIIDTRDGGPVTWTGRLYYVAYTMFTDGNGDFTPNGGVWQMASSFTTGSGMLFATLGVSYILSILGAVADKRAFANSVTGLGMRSEEFLRSGWNGENFNDFDDVLDTLSADLNMLAEQHKSYPILHYYHSEGEDEASPMAVAILSEALTLLHYGVPDEKCPNGALVETTRSSTKDYLQTLDNAFIEPAEQAPPAPDLDRLRETDIPTVADEDFAEAIQEMDESRRKLLAAVEADAWYWPSESDE